MIKHNQQRVAVIGGGIIGVNSAYQLQKRGFKVTIFEPNGLGEGASFGNAGHFATEQVFPLADPALLSQLPKMLFDPLGPFRVNTRYFHKALPWFTRFLTQMSRPTREKNTLAIAALNAVSIASWRRIISELDVPSLLSLNGSLLTFETTDKAVVDKQVAVYRAQGIGVRVLEGIELQEKAPQLDTKVQGALYFTDVGHTVNPLALTQVIAQAFLENGGEVLAESVVTVTDESRPIVSTDKQDRAFDKVVVCAGAYSKVLVKQLGYSVPLETERGYHLMLPLSVDFSCPVASMERKFIMTPMAGGLRLAGTVEFAGNDAKPNYNRSDMLLAHAKAMISPEQCPALHQLSLQEIKQSARWMGRRPSLPDSLPVIDRSPHNASVYFNFGHQHLGLTWGAISGELIAQLIHGEHCDLDITPYRISRF